MNKDAKVNGWREALAEKVCSRTDFAPNAQYVHTPWDLGGEMLGKLKEYTSLADKRILAINLEVVELLCYDFGVKKENVWFITDCKEKANVAKVPRYAGVNVILGDYLDWSTNMKFDVIAGNPPYQAPQEVKNEKGISGGGNTLWDKFIVKSIELLKEGGHLCYVHPSGWRDIAGKFEDTKALLLSKNIKYLEMHTAADGQSTFGAATCYDWYVLQNAPANGKTIVVGAAGAKDEVNLGDIPFVPSDLFEVILPLVAKDGEPTCEVLYSRSGYGTDKPNMSVEKKDAFKYPCIYTITKNGEVVNYWYSTTNKNGHFGIPKVIFTNGGGSSPIVDENGDYGLCQFAYGIADDPKVLPLIQKAMASEKFLKVMKACQMQGFNRYSWKVMRCFKKDFWKQFVDENGNELK